MVKYQDISFTNKQARDEFKNKWIAADYDAAIAMLSNSALDDKVVNASAFNVVATKIIEAEECGDDNFPEYRITGPWTQLPTTVPKSKLCFVYTNWQNGDYQSVQLYEHDGTQWNPCYFKISPKVQAKIDGQTSDIAELTDLTPSVQTNVLLWSGSQESGSAAISNISDYSVIALQTDLGNVTVYLDADGNSGCSYLYQLAANQGAYIHAKRTSTGVDFWAARTRIQPGAPYVGVTKIYGII